MFKTILAAGTVALSLPLAAHAAVLDFEEFAGEGFAQRSTLIETGGYSIRATSGDILSYAPGVVATVPESGSTSIAASNNPNAASPVNSSWTLSRIDNNPFDLLSLRAAEGRNNGQFFAAFASTGLEVLGTYAAGGTVSRTLTFDGIARDNPALDFETFAFADFSGLSSVSLTGFGGTRGGYAFSIDDISVAETAAVPLPAGLPLLLAAFGGLGLVRRRRG